MKQNETNERIKGYKIFDSDFTCRDMKYKVGETFKVNGEIVICKNGIHFCLSPFDCLDYYPFIDCNGNFNKFAQVEGYGKIDKNTTNNRTKVAVSNLDVIKELTLKDFINDGIEFIHKETKVAGSSGDYAKIGSSGYSAQIGSSGYSAQIGSSGNYAKICSSGNAAQIGSSGDSAQIGSGGNAAQIGSSGDSAQIGSSGDSAQIGSSGNAAQIGSSGYSAKIGSSGDSAQICSSGDYAKIGSSGNYAQIGSSGYSAKISSFGDDCVICCAGRNSIAKGKKGSWITLSEWEYSAKKRAYVPVCVKTKKIDGAEIKEDTFYRLKNGEFVEVKGE